MNILVLGASGQLGSVLMAEGQSRSHRMSGTFRSHELPGLIHLDLNNADRVRTLFRSQKPDAIVCCAAWPNADANELDPQRSRRENVDTLRIAADLSREIGARFVFYSSSYVFDGRKGDAYSEADPVCPINEYGRSKVECEELTRDILGEKGLILRTMVVWGPDPQAKNFFWQVWRTAKSGATMKVPSDQLGNPSWSPDVAAATLDLIERGEHGIWNVVGPEARMNRYEFGKVICKVLGCRETILEPVATVQLDQRAPRPLNGGLSPKKLNSAGIRLRSAEEALAAWKRGEGDWSWPAV